jgi:hemerythrin-like domain-containing protein
MKPTQILSDEHRVIETVLDVLERIVQQAQTAGKLERQSALDVLDFIRQYADACHHGKEEAHLFPAMVRKGIPERNGPIGAMLYEHDQGRALVRVMAESLEAAAAGDGAAVDTFIEGAEGYIMLLRGHIRKEDGVLFPMAGRIMDAADEQALMEAFTIVETEHMGHGTHERYLALAKRLADEFGVSTEGWNPAPGCCGHAGHHQ